MSVIVALLAAILQPVAAPLPQAPSSLPAPAGTLNATVQIMLAKDRQPVPFEYVANTIMVQADLAGQHGWMLIDTGASHTIIDTSLAKQVGLPIIQMPGQVISTGGHPVPELRVDDVPLVISGDFSVRMPMLAVDLQALSQASGRRVVGAIGDDLISNMLLMVDKREGRLMLVLGGKLNVSCKTPCPIPPQPIPIERVGTTTGPRERLTANVGGHLLKLTLDTGFSAGMSLTPAAWERVKPADAQVFARASTGASGMIDKVQASRLPKVSFGSTEVEDVQTQVQSWDASFGDGVVGMGVLSSYSFTLDIKAGQLWLLPAPADTARLPPPVLSKP